MQKIINRLYDAVSYYGIDETIVEPKEKDFSILINQYVSLLSIIFFLHDLISLIFAGYVVTSFLLMLISFLFAISLFFPKSFTKKSYVISGTIVLLTLMVTYYSSYCGFESGIFLFYFALVTAVHVFFSWNDNKCVIIFLQVFILSTLYLSAINNFHLIETNSKYKDFDHILLILNISCMLLILALNSFFYHQKIDNYYFTLNQNLYKREQIANLHNEVLRLQKILNKENFSKEALKEIIDSIQLNDILFLEKFELFFPQFFKNLHKHTRSQLTVSDLKMCALLKLGFTSKQIANEINSSLKAVEGRKYRLRKKLDIPSVVDFALWLSNLK